jgi:hypothetical protein
MEESHASFDVDRLAESIPWNRFLGSLKLKKYTSERGKESYGLFQNNFLRFLGFVTFAQAT